jgi:hypothetical protein
MHVDFDSAAAANKRRISAELPKKNLYLGPLMPCFLKWAWILRGTHIIERVSFRMQESSKRIRIRRREGMVKY